MKHVHASTAAAAGVVVGVLAGAGGTNLLADAPVPTERTVQVPAQSGDLPDEQDPLVQWLKEHPRGR